MSPEAGVMAGMRQRLRSPMFVEIDSPASASDAAQRLRRAVGERSSIELEGGATSDRRAAGQVSGDEVRLRVHDADWTRRRKSWNVEFRGEIRAADSRSVLRGRIDIPDRSALRVYMRLARLGVVLVVVVASVVLFRQISEGDRGGLEKAVITVLFAGLAIAGSFWLEASGERNAAEDARLLFEFLKRTLA